MIWLSPLLKDLSGFVDTILYCVILSYLFSAILARTTWTNSGEGKPDLVVDPDKQYKITFKIEGKADRTAKVYKFICAICRLDKTSVHQGLEKLSENRVNGYSI